MASIKSVHARQILDSKGTPTVEAIVELSDGILARSSAPSGVSQSSHEAVELRDQDPAKFNGMGVLHAIQNINEKIAPKIIGMDASMQQQIDRAMIDLDGSANKENLGGNAIISVSQAVLKAAALSSKTPLYDYISGFTSNHDKKIPVPLFALLEGGKHSKGLLDFQEFLLIPASTKTFPESLEIACAVFASLKKSLSDENKSLLSSYEGGFSPELPNNQAALDLLKRSVESAGIAFSLDVFLGLDCAADNLYDGKVYKLSDRTTPYSTDDLVSYYQMLTSDFALIHLEDPLSRTNPEAWKKMQGLSSKAIIVGDDLVSANPYSLQAAVSEKIIGGVVLKPNQVGTFSETVALAEIAKFTNLKICVANRSGETEDTFIADLAVGIGADFVKFGAPTRERAIKYNRMLEIDSELKAKQ